MKRARTRALAALAAVALSSGALAALGDSAQALSNPPIPVLNLDHTIPTSPFQGGPSASDVEGVAAVTPDSSLWVADDNGDRIYEINANTGAYKRRIERAAFEAAGQVGTGTPAGFTRADDLESIIYDPAGDVLYVTSGNCCNSSTVPAQPPYNPTMYKLTRVSGKFEVVSWQALPEGQDPTAAGWRPGHGMYIGKGSKLKTYNYDTNVVGSDISMPVSPIVGVHFVDASTAFITTSGTHTSSGATTAQSDATIRRYSVSGSTWTLVPGWTFTLAGTGLIDARDLAIVGDAFYVSDGYDFRSSSDPLDHAIFVFNLGTAPPPTASFTAIPNTGRAPFSVQFTDTSTPVAPAVGAATSWAWDFTNDGSTDSTAKNPTFNYTTPGNYTAKLTASNASGSTSTTRPITVKAATALPGGYELDGWGGLHPFRVGTGVKPPATVGGGYWKGWDIARGVAVLPTGTGGYTLDGWGALHPFRVGSGAAPPQVSGNPYWVGWDIARGVAILPNGQGGYEVDGYGGIHPFSLRGNSAPPAVIGNPYWLGQDMARGITITPDGKGGYVTDRTGKMHPFKIGSGGVAPPATNGGYSNQVISARGSAIIFDGTGGFTADGWGGLHRFGIGVNAPPPPASDGPYWPGWDITRGVATMPDL